MLYDMLPPAIFFLSLSGVIVIIARVMVRMRQNELAASIRSVAHEEVVAGKSWRGSKTADVLRPSQKSVQAIRSRAGLVRQWVILFKNNVMGSITGVKQRWQEWREQRESAAIKTEGVVAGQESAEVGEVAAPKKRWREAISPTVLSERMRGAAGKMSAAGGDRLGRVREKMSELKERRASGAELEEESVEIKTDGEDRAERVNARVTKLWIGAENKDDVKTKEKMLDEVKRESEGIKTRLVVLDESSEEEPIMAKSRRFRRRREVSALEQAKQALAQKKYQQAEDCLVSHIVKHTKDTSAYMMLGRCAVARGNWDEAVEIFQQVVDWNSKCKGAYAGLGFAAFEAGNYTKALMALQRGHEADPANEKILKCLLTIARRMDNVALQDSILDKLAVTGTSEEKKKIKSAA